MNEVQAIPSAPSSLPWRALLAKWPDLWRERWGRLANAIEEAGCDWREAERQAWNEVHVEKREAETAPTIPMVQARTQAKFKETA